MLSFYLYTHILVHTAKKKEAEKRTYEGRR
jgi:hypothetical protein